MLCYAECRTTGSRAGRLLRRVAGRQAVRGGGVCQPERRAGHPGNQGYHVEVLRAVRGSQGGVGEAVLVREVQGCREGPGVLLLQGLPGAGLAPAQGRVLRQGHPTLTAGAAACVPRPQIGLSTCSPGVCSGFVK